MTPKELASKLIELSKEATHVDVFGASSEFCSFRTLKGSFNSKDIQSLAAAYLKTVECHIVISKMRGTTKNGPWTIAREALREMGES